MMLFASTAEQRGGGEPVAVRGAQADREVQRQAADGSHQGQSRWRDGGVTAPALAAADAETIGYVSGGGVDDRVRHVRVCWVCSCLVSA